MLFPWGRFSEDEHEGVDSGEGGYIPSSLMRMRVLTPSAKGGGEQGRDFACRLRLLRGADGVLSGDDVAAYLSFVAEVDDWSAVEDILDSLASLLQPGSTTRQQVRPSGAAGRKQQCCHPTGKDRANKQSLAPCRAQVKAVISALGGISMVLPLLRLKSSRSRELVPLPVFRRRLRSPPACVGFRRAAFAPEESLGLSSPAAPCPAIASEPLP